MDILRRLKEEKLRRIQARMIAPKLDLKAALFDKQIAAISDTNTFVSFCTTRRAGKSTAKAAKALEIAQKFPNCEVPYIGLTRASTERIIWKTFREFILKYSLPFRMIDGELKIKTLQGSTIFLVGADQTNFIERFRGQKFPIVLIDEAGAFRQSVLQTLVQDVLEPAVADYQGQIIMSGTPGPVPKGFFYEATALKKHGFTSHSWSVLDNPFLPHVTEEWLDEMLKRKGQTRENPSFRREWLGEWVEDLDALVYRYRRQKNDFTGDVPSGAYNIMGVDYGFNDKTAFSIVSYHPNHRSIWIRHSEAHQGMIPSQIAIRLQQLIETFKPTHIVADTGGLGKSITEEMRRRYNIPIKAAEKTDKWAWISLINGEFIDGNLLVHDSCESLKEQYLTLAKDDKGNEDPTMSNDFADSVLYAIRYIHTYYRKELLMPVQDEIEKFKQKEKQWLEKQNSLQFKEWWEQEGML